MRYRGRCSDAACNPQKSLLDELLSDEGKYIGDKNILHEHLSTKVISRVWWKLSDRDRETLATEIIKAYSLSIGCLDEHCLGEENCGGCDYTECFHAVCIHNAVTRMSFMSTGMYGSVDVYEKYLWSDFPYGWTTKVKNVYWRKRKGTKVLSSCMWIPSSQRFDLPCFYVQINPFGHAICAIQIKQDGSDLGSYRFFQYTAGDIKPGDWQMPHGNTVMISNISKLYQHASGVDYKVVVSFDV